MGRPVVAVVNLPPRQVGKFMSQVLMIGFPDAEGEVVLFAPTRLWRMGQDCFDRGGGPRPYFPRTS